MRSDRIPIKIGEKHAMLTILKELKPRITKWGNSRMVLCRCECGKKIKILLRSVRTEQSKSCGCLTAIRAKECRPSVIHGLRYHPLYSIWQNIKNRCYNNRVKAYNNYGGVGVKVCEEWVNDFKLFYDWAIKNGWKKGLEIDKDKIPNKLGIEAIMYSPKMCSIITTVENNRLRKTTITQEKAKEIKDMYKKIGGPMKAVGDRCGVSQSLVQKIIGGKHWTSCGQ